MSDTANTTRAYRYKGWEFFQVRRGQWTLTREADGFRTWHHSRTGAEAFVRLFGTAADPDTAALEMTGTLARYL